MPIAGRVALLACLFGAFGLVGSADQTIAPSVPVAATGGLGRARDLSRAFIAVAKGVTPAVVNISSMRVEGGRETLASSVFGGLFSDLFVEPPHEVHSLGSGVIFRPDGFIVTNQHVIQGAQEIKVTLGDDREFDAKLIGQDTFTDVAVIKIETTGLAVAPFGDASKLEVGEWVIAIGSPLGLAETVTAGIVSAKGRKNVGISGYEDFIQTDAAINPGNSGGALVNLDGELVGINTAIASEGGGYDGVCFATPTTVVLPVVDALIRDGKIRRPWIGVVPKSINQDLSERLSVPENGGILVYNMIRNGPAHKANLRPGDVITAWEGKPLKDGAGLTDLIQATPIGTTVKLTVVRGGKTYKDCKLAVEERPQDIQTRGVQ